MEWTLWWSLLVLAVGASALCSGLEVGGYSLNRVRLDLRAARTPPDPDARVLLSELRQPARLLATLLICNNIVNAIAAEAASSILQAGAYSAVAIAIINTLVLGPILFILGDAAPKEVFRVESDRLTPLFARSIKGVRIALTLLGVLPLVQFLSHLLERALKLPLDSAADARQRIAQLLKEGASHGVLSESQVSLLDRALMFGTIAVRDEMVAWEKVMVLPASAERSRVLDLVAGSAHAFFPVVDRQGRVIGAIRHLDLYTQTRKSPQELVLPVPRIKPEASARDALAGLRTHKARIAIVEDAWGKPVGIVSAKDLVEPLTGELLSL
jgi:CBS domain containing-hemolysin-like protein